MLAIALVKIFGGYLKDAVTKASCGVMGKDYVEGEKVGEGYCEGDLDRLFD